jgi:hypothetical protein
MTCHDIVVRNRNGDIYKLNQIDLQNTTVLSLKRKIEELSKIPVDKQRLFFGPFELENSQQPLSKLNLRDGSVIHLV